MPEDQPAELGDHLARRVCHGAHARSARSLAELARVLENPAMYWATHVGMANGSTQLS